MQVPEGASAEGRCGGGVAGRGLQRTQCCCYGVKWMFGGCFPVGRPELLVPSTALPKLSFAF